MDRSNEMRRLRQDRRTKLHYELGKVLDGEMDFTDIARAMAVEGLAEMGADVTGLVAAVLVDRIHLLDQEMLLDVWKAATKEIEGREIG
jgi:hypothetical protein